jgi:signal transduction histidine kinase/predicted metal-dependent phosphoesterase TrpH
MTKWLLADLHIHFTFSDGEIPVEEIAKIYGEARFDVIAITDHVFDTQSPISLRLHEEGKSVNDVEAYFHRVEEVSLWAKQSYNLLVIPGLEICNLVEDYHILGIDLKEAIDPNQDATGVIDEIHRQRGLAIASHPHLKLSYFLNGDNESIQRHPLHLWKHRKRYANKIDAWEIANREDLFGIVSLEGFPYVANSDFHNRQHLTSWKSLIFAEKERESIKGAIRQKKLSLFFFAEEGSERKPLPVGTLFEKGTDSNETEEPGTAKILIADDEKDLVEMLAYNFRKRGYQIVTAYDGFEAWEKIESEKPDLMILDLMMPGLDGWELCRLIRQNGREEIKNIGILMLTARAMAEDRIYGLEIGADDYLTKPFSIAELILRVEKIIQKREIISELHAQMAHQWGEIEKREESLRKVVHDLKTPLISMGTSAKLLLRKEQAEKKSKFLGSIYENSLKLTRWVDDALKSFNLFPQEWKDQMREVEIESMVKGGIDLLRDTGEKKEIEVIFRSLPPIPSLQCNEHLLQRALNNILSNALKYTPRGGRVEVSVIPYIRKGGYGGVIEISVKDTGIGINQEDIEKIFNPFYRGKNAKEEDGVGLGLSFVKEVVELHGGRILVQSELNEGSTFSILLPIGNSPQEEGIEKQRESSA